MDCMRNHLHEGVVLNGRYETISALNHGSFGMVFQAFDLFTGDHVAIKVITKASAANTCDSPISIDERSEELSIHNRIAGHPNVVNLLDSFESEHHIYLVLEFCSNGDLYEAIRVGKGPLETEHVRDFMLQLVSAVEFMHKRGVYHRDIKPENIFLAQSGDMKLGDFGLATTDVWSYDIAVGSDRYMAPEQYDPTHDGYSTAKADVWAIGICLLNVLFSRNPFAVPNCSDPLYADFALDRQTLFDVFSNMSQDTYDVLMYCLAIDPEKRDLSLVRDALERVVSFTTDDEILDDFCTVVTEPVIASANREPLRTPSISTPQLDQGGSFPWAKALAMSPPQPMRQLSAIPDTEVYSDDIFIDSHSSDRDWYAVKPETASTVSFVDSGLGLSFRSNNATPSESIEISRSKPMPISGSLPGHLARPFHSMVSAFGKKRDAISKSWSDLWDEEEEEHAQAEAEFNFFPAEKEKNYFESADIHIENVENNYLPFGNVKREQERESCSGVSTPRGGLSEMKNPAIVNNSRSRTPPSNRQATEHVSQQTGFIFEECSPAPPKYSPPSKRTIMDKWAALGDRRRAPQQQTPQKSGKFPKHSQASPTSARKRSRTGSWRRPINWGPAQHENLSGIWEKKDVCWTAKDDWRHSNSSLDDIGDLEWVGGWNENDLHL